MEWRRFEISTVGYGENRKRGITLEKNQLKKRKKHFCENVNFSPFYSYILKNKNLQNNYLFAIMYEFCHEPLILLHNSLTFEVLLLEIHQ